MVDAVTLVYVGGITVLFFFWAYGIVSFVLDLKNKFVPGAILYVRGRREQKEEQHREQEREDQERQLY